MKLNLLREGEVEEYNFWIDDIEPVISLYVKEEFLHILAAGYISGVDRFDEAWETFEDHLLYVRELKPPVGEVDRKFMELINRIRRQEDDFMDSYDSDIPGGKDLLHLATADVTGCDVFVTADTQFGTRLPDLDLGLDSVSTVVIIDDDTLDIADEHPLN